MAVRKLRPAVVVGPEASAPFAAETRPRWQFPSQSPELPGIGPELSGQSFWLQPEDPRPSKLVECACASAVCCARQPGSHKRLLEPRFGPQVCSMSAPNLPVKEVMISCKSFGLGLWLQSLARGISGSCKIFCWRWWPCAFSGSWQAPIFRKRCSWQRLALLWLLVWEAVRACGLAADVCQGSLSKLVVLCGSLKVLRLMANACSVCALNSACESWRRRSRSCVLGAKPVLFRKAMRATAACPRRCLWQPSKAEGRVMSFM